MIAVGMLDRRIQLQWPTITSSSTFGGVEEVTWLYIDRWAHVVEKGAVELQEANEFVNASTVEFYTHYIETNDVEGGNPVPDDTWRIKWTENKVDRFFYVKSVDEINGRLHRYHKFIAVMKSNEINNT